MTESQFIRENVADWEALEAMLAKSDSNPDLLQKLFVKVSGDLSYASTYYPNRSVRLYLNKLTQQVFDSIEKESKSRFDMEDVKHFFRFTLPLEVYRSRKSFLLAFIIFVGAMIIGAISTHHSDEFARLILGNGYVEMTEQNINEGDPMAVYKDAEQVDMFLGITINNIKVSFIAFVAGIFAGLGTLVLLLYNGIMVGTFQYFFYKKGLLATSFFTIWIHGTLEISAIIIAGAAGFVLGSGLLFPGTYSRAISLQVSAKRAVRIIVGIVPLFIVAGFLESFVTRMTELPLIVKALIILGSLAIILGLYVWYPWWVYKQQHDESDYEVIPQDTLTELDTQDRKMTYGDTLADGFTMYRLVAGHYFSFLIKWIIPVLIVTFGVWVKYFSNLIMPHVSGFSLLHYDNAGAPLYGIYLLVVSVLVLLCIMLFHEQEFKFTTFLIYLKRLFFKTLLLVAIPLAAVYFFQWWAAFLVFLFLPIPYIFGSIYESVRGNKVELFAPSYSIYGYVLIHITVLGLLHLLLLVVINFGIGAYLYDFLLWHDVFSVQFGSEVFFRSLVHMFIHLIMLPLYIYTTLFSYKSYVAKSTAIDLRDKYIRFGTESNIFEAR